MKTLNVIVQSGDGLKDEVLRNLARADAEPDFQATPTYSFSSWERLHEMLNSTRMEIIRRMAGKGPMRVRDVAALVGRDVKNVHGDLTRLAKNGVIDKTDEGFVFPYDRIHIEFDMEAAA